MVSVLSSEHGYDGRRGRTSIGEEEARRREREQAFDLQTVNPRSVSVQLLERVGVRAGRTVPLRLSK